MFNNDFNNDFLKEAIMKKEELLNLIETRIKGLGNQVDIGGALVPILSDLVQTVKPLEVEDITALTSLQLDALDAGEMVVKITGTEKHVYLVNYKDEEKGELLLTYADWQNVEGVYYEKGDLGWAYVQTDTTHISQ